MYKLKKIVGSDHFSAQFIKIISHYRKIGYNTNVQEVYHVYLNKFKIALSHLFLILFSDDTFTLVNLTSWNAQPPRKYLLTLFAG